MTILRLERVMSVFMFSVVSISAWLDVISYGLCSVLLSIKTLPMKDGKINLVGNPHC